VPRYDQGLVAIQVNVEQVVGRLAQEQADVEGGARGEQSVQVAGPGPEVLPPRNKTLLAPVGYGDGEAAALEVVAGGAPGVLG
jgi:hypothetical protein